MTDRKKAVPLRAGPSQDPGRQNPDVHPGPTRSLSLSFPDLETQRKSTHSHMISAPMAPPAGMNSAVTTVGRTCPSDGSEITKREAHQDHTSRRRYNLLLLICSALSLPSPRGCQASLCSVTVHSKTGCFVPSLSLFLITELILQPSLKSVLGRS